MISNTQPIHNLPPNDTMIIQIPYTPSYFRHICICNYMNSPCVIVTLSIPLLLSYISVWQVFGRIFIEIGLLCLSSLIDSHTYWWWLVSMYVLTLSTLLTGTEMLSVTAASVNITKATNHTLTIYDI